MASDPAKLHNNMDLESIEKQLKEVHDLSLKLVEEVLEEKIEYETLFGRAELQPKPEQELRPDATYICVKQSEPEESMTLQKRAQSNDKLPEDTQVVAGTLKATESVELTESVEQLQNKIELEDKRPDSPKQNMKGGGHGIHSSNHIEELKEKLNELNTAKLLKIKMFDQIAADGQESEKKAKDIEKELEEVVKQPEPLFIPNATNVPVAFALLPEETFTKSAEKNNPGMKFFFGSLENVKAPLEKFELTIEPKVEPVLINLQLNDPSQSVFELVESVQDVAGKLLKDSEQVLEHFESTIEKCEVSNKISTTDIELPFLTKLKRAAFGFAPQEELVELKKQQKRSQTPVITIPDQFPDVLEAANFLEVPDTQTQESGLVEKLINLGLIDSFPDDDGFGVDSSSTFDEIEPIQNITPVEENFPVEGRFIFMANIPEVLRIEELVPVEENDISERTLEIENWEFKLQQPLLQPFPQLAQDGLVDSEKVQRQNKKLRRCEAAEDLSVIGSSSSDASSSVRSDTTGSQRYTGAIKKGSIGSPSNEVEIETTYMLSQTNVEPLPHLRSVTTLSSLQHMCKPGVARDLETKSNGEDDDGYSNLPEVSSDKVSRVMSSAWIDNSIDFTVDEKQSLHNRAPLGQAGDSKNKFIFEDTVRPLTKEPKKNSKYKFFFKRISKIFRKSKN